MANDQVKPSVITKIGIRKFASEEAHAKNEPFAVTETVETLTDEQVAALPDDIKRGLGLPIETK